MLSAHPYSMNTVTYIYVSSALRQSKQMYQQLSLKENCLQLRSPPSETKEGE